jgi:hypothetical protein
LFVCAARMRGVMSGVKVEEAHSRDSQLCASQTDENLILKNFNIM